MDFIQDNILNLVIFSPLLASFFILLLPGDAKNTIRRLALIFSLVPLLLVLVMWFTYDRFDAGIQFEYVHEWFPMLGSSYHVGVDGISLTMLLLTTILTPLAILASFGIEQRVNIFMALFLLMEAAMLGLFAVTLLLQRFVPAT